MVQDDWETLRDRPTHAELLRAARRAVVEASVACRWVQAQLSSGDRMTKADASPVTVADLAAQALITRRLRLDLGDGAAVGEEDADELRAMLKRGEADVPGRVLAAVRLVWADAGMDEVLDAIDEGNAGAEGSFWTIDPIDGTKGFLRLQQYAVCMAWIEGGSPMVAAMACPNLSMDPGADVAKADGGGVVFSTVRGGGVVMGGLDAEGDSAVAHDGSRGGPVVALGSVEREHTHLSAVARVLDVAVPGCARLRMDSQAKYGVVARGQADIYLRLPSRRGYVERIWDHAPGVLIAEEAGLTASDMRGRALNFGVGDRLRENRGIVVAPEEIHGRLIGAVAEVLGADD